VRKFRIAVVVSLALAVGQQSSAQDLTTSLLERYLEALREQSGIPGMSAAVVQDGRVIWKKGFGFQNVRRVFVGVVHFRQEVFVSFPPQVDQSPAYADNAAAGPDVPVRGILLQELFLQGGGVV
jgi:hypothetical protein